MRHDIARILTVVNERALGISTIVEDDLAPVAVATVAKDEGFEPEEAVVETPATEPAKPRRGRKAKSEEGA